MPHTKTAACVKTARTIQRRFRLTNKQLVFAREIAKGNNQKKDAIKAGYPEYRAEITGSKKLV